MASVVGKLSYKRLINEEELDERTLQKEVRKAKAWLKLRALAGRRRPRLRIAGLKKFLRKRTKFFVSRSVRVSWREALNKVKNGQSHWNDLLGGNFLFMQGNPTPCASYKPHVRYVFHDYRQRSTPLEDSSN